MKDKTLKRLAAIEAHEPAVEDDGQALVRLTARYEQIAARLRAQPDWKEPTEAELEATRVQMKTYFDSLRASYSERAS
jgi:hypothetical protein